MRGIFSRIHKDKLLIDALTIFIGTNIAGVINLVYQLIAVRLLSIPDFGTFNALVSLLLLVGLAISPLTTTLARIFSELRARNELYTVRAVFRNVNRDLAIVVLLFTFVLIWVLPGAAAFFTTTKLNIILIAVLVVLSLFASPMLALAQGMESFRAYSLMCIIPAMGKLIIGLLAMTAGFMVIGALTGYIANYVIVLTLAGIFMLRHFRAHKEEIQSERPNATVLKSVYSDFIPVSLAMFAFSVMTNVDVMYVKHLFSAQDAGFYSHAQIVGKIFLFLPFSLAIVLLPKTAASAAQQKNAISILFKMLLITLCMCIPGIVVCFAFPSFVLTILAGRAHAASVSLVGLFSLSMSLFSILWILVNYLLGKRHIWFIAYLLVVAALQWLAIAMWHAQLATVLGICIASGAVSCGICFFLAVNDKK